MIFPQNGTVFGMTFEDAHEPRLQHLYIAGLFFHVFNVVKALGAPGPSKWDWAFGFVGMIQDSKNT